jgi:hypothetical protein
VHGYAITAYVAQGMTCERAYVLARDDAYREWAYDESAPADCVRTARAALTAALSRSDERPFASENVERGSGPVRS